VILAAAVAVAALAWPAGSAAGQQPSAEPKGRLATGSSTSITATVTAIDAAKRELTLKTAEGESVVMEVPDVVKRFDEIKVGDQLTIAYHEAILVDIHKADAGAKLGVSAETSLERKQTAKPSGVVSQQITATVEVVSVDMKTPSITVREADGKDTTFKVKHVKNLEGVKAGDKLSITYKEAVAMSIASPAAK
jgi:hypothetical protein